MKQYKTLLIAALATAFPTVALGADVEAAKALAEQNNCLQCHGIKKDKDGPSFLKTAEKFRGKADAESEVIKHLNSGKEIKLADGTKEKHKVIKTIPPNDAAQVRNLVQYILSVQP
jgi:cytochrome c